MIKFPIKYINGNYSITIEKDGTKIKQTLKENDDKFISSFPETIDLNISNYCENNCKYCYIDASIDGKHAELFDANGEILNVFKTIPRYTEVAINYCFHPDFENFIKTFTNMDIIVNITVHQKDLIKDYKKIINYQKMGYIYGIGISVIDYSQKLINIVNKLDNVVFHIIAGITPLKLIHDIDGNYKILILGYKTKGRGKFIQPNLNLFIKNLFWIVSRFKVVSFDNLALCQLNIKDYIGEDKFNDFYLGDDGQHSFYIDAVSKEFSKSSVDNVFYKIDDRDVCNMFNKIKGIKND